MDTDRKPAVSGKEPEGGILGFRQISICPLRICADRPVNISGIQGVARQQADAIMAILFQPLIGQEMLFEDHALGQGEGDQCQLTMPQFTLQAQIGAR